jgi:hypothetical protein
MQAVDQVLLAQFGITAEDRKSEFSDMLRSVPECVNGEPGFTCTSVATRNTEDTDARNGSGVSATLESRRNRQVGADWHKRYFGTTVRLPGKLFRGNGKEAKIGELHCPTHRSDLNRMSQKINQARPTIRLDIVKYDTHPRACGLKDLQDAAESMWEATCGPGQSRVLNEHPRADPMGRFESQTSKRLSPTAGFPREMANFELDIMRLESSAQVTTIFFDRVGRFVTAA